MKNILIVDDDSGVRSVPSKFLQARKYFTEETASEASAINKALKNEYKVNVLHKKKVPS